MNTFNYKHFANKKCEYYPCHNTKKLNCLFCFCPLYSFRNCGGNYSTLENGIKDCSDCLIPHSDSGYEYIIERLKNEVR